MPSDQMPNHFLDLVLKADPNLLNAISRNDFKTIVASKRIHIQKIIKAYEGMKAYRKINIPTIYDNDKVNAEKRLLQKNHIINMDSPTVVDSFLKASELVDLYNSGLEFGKFEIREDLYGDKTKLEVTMVGAINESKYRGIVLKEWAEKQEIDKLEQMFKELSPTQKKTLDSLLSLKKGEPLTTKQIKSIAEKFQDPETAQEKINEYQNKANLLKTELSISDQQKESHKSSRFGFLRKLSIDQTAQKSMAIELASIKESFKNLEITSNQAAEAILTLLKENQERHQQAIFSTVSSFNLKTIKELDPQIKEIVCKELNINDKLLENPSYKNRQKLAHLIKDHEAPPIERKPKDRPSH